ncbi:YdcF family protein [Sphaerisporangium album]|uniref:YdcF family protein n=1 Tax=Sphaerisporangium album TaxID=509200 RepID=A0A367F8N0_9ACTN|nr:YdcF family protein [Sphaerisporangium album]RCG25920.1 YdcF family protein [Sphaerisporangium album]
MTTDWKDIPDNVREATQVLWDYHNMHHELRPTDVGIGLGSHDLGVADYTAELFHKGMFPIIVFTGANAPTTVALFPRGEAVHYRERALELGVPPEAILLEPRATHTGENISMTRQILAKHSIYPSSVTLISRPYQQRRAFATSKKLWPEVDVVCASRPISLEQYIREIRDPLRVLHMLAGDTQRVIEYPSHGYAITQDVPPNIYAALEHLIAAGFTNRLIRGNS